MMIFQAIFWLILAGVAYAYVGFPILLVLRGLFRRPVKRLPATPTLSVIIIAFNEQDVIAAKIDNVLSLDYPADKLQIIVGSDGSEDDTNEIVSSYQDRGVVLVSGPRRGKIATLNETARSATGEIFVFSDANSMLEQQSLAAIAGCFSDAQVGGVAGDQRYSNDSGNAASLGERVFWSFDRFLKQMQSRAGNATSSTGALHAVRGELFEPIPSGVSDDFLISTRVILRGYRLVFEGDAVAREPVSPTDGDEFKRKKRVIARGIRAVWEMRRLLNPFEFGFYSVQLASHKLLRWGVIFALPLLFLLNLLLVTSGVIFQAMLLAQITFYSLALLAFCFRNSSLLKLRLLKPLSIPYFFCLANVAALAGWIDFFAGHRVDVWNNQRAEGSPPKNSADAQTP